MKITAKNTQPRLLKVSLITAVSALLLSSCQSTRPEPYLGTPPDNKGIVQTVPNGVSEEFLQFLPKQSRTIHERNFQIWLKNQTAVKGMVAFNSTAPCPDAMGHGQ
jgi:hypothetical protein